MSQTDITPEMRAIMVDWLVEVGQEYRLTPLTLYLCVRPTLCTVHRTALLS